MTTAKTSLVENVASKYLLYYYLYAVKNPCSQNRSNQYLHCSSTAFQSQSSHRKMFHQDFVYLLILIYFLRTPFGPREWACGLGIVYLHTCFSNISAMPLYFLIKLVLLFPLCILYKQRNLQTKITA